MIDRMRRRSGAASGLTAAYPETKVVLHNLDLIEKYVREFLGKELKREKAPLLNRGDASVPEATVKRYGR